MHADEFFAEHLGAHPVMAIFRNQNPEATVRLCRAAWSSGVALVEIPLSGADAEHSLQAAIEAGAAEGRLVGAGTVLTVAQLERVVAAGAVFTVAPGLDDDVVLRARELGVPHLPGVATASEIGRAVRLGLSWVKAFPAAELGASWVKAQHGPFPEVSFVATGGMSASNTLDFLDSGYSAVGIGSAFETLEGIQALATALARRAS